MKIKLPAIAITITIGCPAFAITLGELSYLEMLNTPLLSMQEQAFSQDTKEVVIGSKELKLKIAADTKGQLASVETLGF